MNKSRLAVMFLTFAVLIAITPFIFGKLMNSRFNQMLDNLRKKGIDVKIVQNKSTYLKTDKILHVVIPGKYLSSEGVLKAVDLNIETQFKNLPVTSVIFSGGINKILLSDGFERYQPEINSFLKKYVSFTVTTPDFKHYYYKFSDINVKSDKNVNIGVKHITGTFKFAESINNELKIAEIYMKNEKGIIEIKNFVNNFEKYKNESYSKNRFNADIKFKPFKIELNNVFNTTKIITAENTDINSSFGFDTLNASSFGNIEKFNTVVGIKGLDTEVFKKLSRTDDEKLKNEYINQIFEKGFKINIKSFVKNIDAMHKKFGGYTLDLNVCFLPVKNVRKKLNSNNVNFIDAKLNFTTTPQIAALIMNIYPKSAFLFTLAKKQNGRIILNLELKKGKLYSDGQLVK